MNFHAQFLTLPENNIDKNVYFAGIDDNGNRVYHCDSLITTSGFIKKFGGKTSLGILGKYQFIITISN